MAIKEIIGQLISDKMNKTITVAVHSKTAHKKYKKIISKTKKYFVHDENNTYKAGDFVKIKATRPISKNKCWTVIELIN